MIVESKIALVVASGHVSLHWRIIKYSAVKNYGSGHVVNFCCILWIFQGVAHPPASVGSPGAPLPPPWGEGRRTQREGVAGWVEVLGP